MTDGRIADGASVLAREITEKQLSQHVVSLARALGWKVARWPTWRSTGTAPGVPDLLLARRGRVILAELKAERGALRPEQEEWARAVLGSGAEWCVWRPARWLSGEIEADLRRENSRV